MPTESMPKPTDIEVAAHEMLVDNLRNTHALERQQIQVLNAHLKLFAELPDLHARVTEHILESREQARRLEAALESCGDSPSMFKDALLSVMGLGQSAVQGYGNDAVLKAVMADIMQEHLEIATYRALITLAEMAGKAELRARLVATLREEEAMAVWFDENLEAITRQVVEIKAQEHADSAMKDDAAAHDESPTSDDEMSGTLWQQLENAKQSSAHRNSAAEQKPDRTPENPDATPSPESTRPAKPTALTDSEDSRPSEPTNRT